MKLCQPYLDFIKYVINENKIIPSSSQQIDWSSFFCFCNQQGIIGLIFDGLQKSDLRIPQTTLFEWISFVESIKQKNEIVNKRIDQITKFFDANARRSCILKGQANALMYPKPELRTPGDIDIWVEGNIKDIIELVKKVDSKAYFTFHHIQLPIFKDVSVEVHYKPTYLVSWSANKKLQNYISRIENFQFYRRRYMGQ